MIARMNLLVVCAVVVLVALPAMCQPPETKQTEEKQPNAAVAYANAWFLFNETDRRATPRARDIDAGWAPDDDLIKVLDREREMLGGVVYASRIEDCDWQLRCELGIRLLLPHADLARKCAVLLVADARRLSDDDPDAAGRRLAAVLRMADHISDDRVLLMSKSAVQIASFAAGDVGRLLDNHELTRETIEELRDAMRRLEHDDSFYFKASIENEVEGAMRHSAMELLYADREQVGMWEAITLSDEPRKPRNRAEQEQVDELVEKARVWAHFAVSAWDEPDGGDKLDTLHESVTVGAYGKLARAGASRLTRLWRDWRATKDCLDALTQRLDTLLAE